MMEEIQEQLYKYFAKGKITKIEMADLVKKILLNQAVEDNIALSEEQINCFSFIEYYKQNNKGNYNLIKSFVPSYKKYQTMTGQYDPQTNSILICSDHLYSILYPYDIRIQIIKLLKTTFHEYYHMKESYDRNENNNFNPYTWIESRQDRDYYLLNHDNFIEEIEADLYAINKIKELFKNDKEMLDIIDSKFIETKHEMIKNYINYDINTFIKELDKQIKENPEILEEKNII